MKSIKSESRLIGMLANRDIPHQKVKLMIDIAEGKVEQNKSLKPLLMNATQSAELLGRSRSWFIRQVNAGIILSVKIGESRWFRTQDLEKFVQTLTR